MTVSDIQHNLTYTTCAHKYFNPSITLTSQLYNPQFTIGLQTQATCITQRKTRDITQYNVSTLLPNQSTMHRESI